MSTLFSEQTLREAARLARRPEGVTAGELYAHFESARQPLVVTAADRDKRFGLSRRTCGVVRETLEQEPGARVELEDTWRTHPTRRVFLPGGDA